MSALWKETDFVFMGFGIRTFSWQNFNEKKKKNPRTLMSDWLHSPPHYNTQKKKPLRHVVFNTTAGTHEIMQPLCFGRPFCKFMSQYNGSISGFWLCGEIRTRQHTIPLTSGMSLKMFNCHLGVKKKFPHLGGYNSLPYPKINRYNYSLFLAKKKKLFL